MILWRDNASVLFIQTTEKLLLLPQSGSVKLAKIRKCKSTSLRANKMEI